MKITIEAQNEDEAQHMLRSMKARKLVFEDMNNVAVIGSRVVQGIDPETDKETPIGIQPIYWTWVNGMEGAGLLIGFCETAKTQLQEIRLNAVRVPKQPLIQPAGPLVNGPIRRM